jgi:hypothetical protein
MGAGRNNIEMLKLNMGTSKRPVLLKRGGLGPPKPVTSFPFQIKKASLSGGSFVVEIFPRFNLFRKLRRFWFPQIRHSTLGA